MLSTVQKLVRLLTSQLRNQREFVRLKRNCVRLCSAES
jgi:hypothetical protein